MIFFDTLLISFDYADYVFDALRCHAIAFMIDHDTLPADFLLRYYACFIITIFDMPYSHAIISMSIFCFSRYFFMLLFSLPSRFADV